MNNTIFDFKVEDAKGKKFEMNSLKGKVQLIVNVASHCGFTNQYEGLEKLQKKYSTKGFSVLGFPCNQFGAQEPGSDAEIQDFCSTKYHISFPVLAKIEVNGEKTAPIFEFLKKAAPGAANTEAIKWNFTKFLVDKSGKVITRFAPQTTPEDLDKEIAKLIEEN